MTGTVTEESGAVVPDARIELADITTGTTYSSLSSDLGILVFRRCRIGGSSATIQLLQLLDAYASSRVDKSCIITLSRGNRNSVKNKKMPTPIESG